MRARTFFLPFACLAAAAQAQIVQYTAPGSSFNPTSTAAHTVASALNDTGSSADLQPGATLPNSVFLQQEITSPDPASAVANNQYFQFSVAPTGGFGFNFSSLTFDAGKGGSSSPRGWVLRSSLDGFAANIATDVVPTQQPTMTSFSVAFAGSLFQNVLTETTFRIYGYAPTTNVGMFYDNITLNGDVFATGSELIRYEAPGSTFAPTFVASGLTASDLNDTGSSADLQPGATLPNSVFLQQEIVSPDPASAVANNQFFQFTASVQAGSEMDLTALTFDAGKGGSSDPRGWVLRSSIDGFASDIATSGVTTIQPNLSGFGVDLTAAMFQNLTSDITFRIYGYAPTANVGMFYDNIVLYGSTQPVPEPATLAALGLGVLGFARKRRKRSL